MNPDCIPTGQPATTLIEVEEFTFPLLAVIMACPTIPGVNKPSESIAPELADQIIGSLIGLPDESLTIAEKRTAWSALTL